MRPTVLGSLTFVVAFVMGVVLSALALYLLSTKSDVAPISIEDNQQHVPDVIIVDPTPNSPIRSVDFRNFDYPGLPGTPRTLKVRDGKRPPTRIDSIGRPLDISLSVADVTYGDVTGDGDEDAIVDLSWETGGTAQLDLIYIYTMNKSKVRLLWAFEGGDRTDGGVKRVFAGDGGLVVELFGKDKIIGSDLYAPDGVHTGLCCPVLFTRTQYVWKGGRFRRLRSEVVPHKPETN